MCSQGVVRVYQLTVGGRFQLVSCEQASKQEKAAEDPAFEARQKWGERILGEFYRAK